MNKKEHNSGIPTDRPFTIEEAKEYGITRQHLHNLYQSGLMVKVDTGIYAVSDSEMSDMHSLEAVALKAPTGVICLLSALRFHDMTTQFPQDIWLALRAHSRIPKINFVSIRAVMMSDESYEFGIEDHFIDGVKIKVYSPAKTVADCFKYRNKIGLDVAIEALRDGIRRKHFTISELMLAAKKCRVANVIKPYAESIVNE